MTNTQLHDTRAALLAELSNVTSAETLEAFKLAHLTRKGTIAQLFDDLKSVPREEKPELGKLLNFLRRDVEAEFGSRAASLGASKPKAGENIDLTMPSRPWPVYESGHEHPLMRTYNEMVSIFERMGFAVETGPEIEDEEHNFGKLNFAPDHPARDMQDTFFVAPSPTWTKEKPTGANPLVLRTHTSPVQIRVMESQPPPIRSIMPGRVYRNEELTARSGVAFFQIEGLVIDHGVTMADLKGVLTAFVKQFFGSDIKTKFRPSYFPFTEPSAELDISCFICAGKGCRVCKQSGWLEILGSGMVHPNVLRNCGIDPEVYSGYAFGLGIDRTAMMRYGINDLRNFFENDLRFLRQF